VSLQDECESMAATDYDLCISGRRVLCDCQQGIAGVSSFRPLSHLQTNRSHKEAVMTKFRLGGSGPDGRGLGWVSGIMRRRFDKSGEIYETDDLCEIRALRRCSYVEEMADKEGAGERGSGGAREVLRREKMRELIKIGRGLYRVGMTKSELIDRIIAGDHGS
jgi:hypothetical protein